MSEYATQPATEWVTTSPQDSYDDEYQRYYGVDYTPLAGNASPAAVTNAVGHYAEDPQKKLDEKIEQRAGFADLIGRTFDVFGTATGNETMKRIGAGGAVFGDAAKAGKGIRDGEGFDVFNGSTGVVADVAGMLGVEPAAVIAGEMKGGGEVVQGIDQFARGVDNDNGQMQVEALRKTLDGVADFSGSMPEEHAQGFGKALGYGMAIGDAWAPTIFGDKSVSSDVQKSDGTYVASTGNGAVDWILGEGRYSESRLHGDGTTGEERANHEFTQDFKAQVNAMVEQSSPEDRENAEEQRRIIEGLTGVKISD